MPRHRIRSLDPFRRLFVPGPALLGGSGGETPLIYLLRDEFTTAEAAPLTSPRTCEPGPGAAGITDSASDLSISGGKLVMSGASSTGDPMVDLDLSSGVATRLAGLAVCVKAGLPADLNRFALGLDSSLDSTPEPVNMRVVRSSGSDYVEFIVDNSATSSIVFTSTGVHRNYLIVLRSVGCFFSIDGTLQWVGNANSAVLDAVMLTSWLGTSTGAIFDDLSVLSLPANGYTAWDADFSTVTDTRSTTGAFNIPATGDYHYTSVFTFTAGISLDIFTDYLASPFYALNTTANSLGAFNLSKRINSALVYIKTAPGTFSDGVEYKIDLIRSGDDVIIYLDNVLWYNGAGVGDLSDLPRLGTGSISGSLGAANTITTHPYPALGIATDRVVCPKAGDVMDCPSDCLIELKNFQLPLSERHFFFRGIKHDVSPYCLGLIAVANGGGAIKKYDSGTGSSLITLSVGTIADGDDLMIVADGANIQLFVNGVSAGSTSAAPYTDNTGAKLYSQIYMDHIACFPRDVTSLLPSELV